MKCLIIEKRLDGSYQVTSFVNADGSPSYKSYRDAQEASLAIPVLSKDLAGISRDADRSTVFFNEDGSIASGESHVFPVNKDDFGQRGEIVKDLAQSKVTDLANSILADLGKPILPTSPALEEPLNP